MSAILPSWVDTPTRAAIVDFVTRVTDDTREFAYDRQHVPSGQLDKGLDEAARYGWLDITTTSLLLTPLPSESHFPSNDHAKLNIFPTL